MRISDLQKCKSDLQSVNIRPTISVNPTYANAYIRPTIDDHPTYKCVHPTYKCIYPSYKSA